MKAPSGYTTLALTELKRQSRTKIRTFSFIAHKLDGEDILLRGLLRGNGKNAITPALQKWTTRSFQTQSKRAPKAQELVRC